ncbi:hypothetical protein CS542_07235 [Pedobacter sp. IW39]|nr:hypothetical protein CS542_07235 [Pedobacter sp. IW39]
MIYSKLSSSSNSFKRCSGVHQQYKRTSANSIQAITSTLSVNCIRLQSFFYLLRQQEIELHCWKAQINVRMC